MGELLAIAGGVVSVYIIFALIATTVTEWIAALMNLRGRTLYAGIVEMLSAAKVGVLRAPTLSYDKPADAAAAVATPGISVYGATLANAIYTHPLVANLGMKELPSYIDARTFTLSLLTSIPAVVKTRRDRGSAPDIGADGVALLADLEQRIRSMPADDPLARSLGIIVIEAQGDYRRALLAVDAWFEAQMDRISGTYKRYATLIQIGVALVIVLVFNVDTIGIVQELTRTSATALAVNVRGASNTAPIAANLQILADSGLKLVFPASSASSPIGLLVSWFAILLGAPFWFDVLKQIVPVRLSGGKPDADAAKKGDKQASLPAV